MTNHTQMRKPRSARLVAAQALVKIWQGQGGLDDIDMRGLEPQARAEALRLTRESLRHFDGFEKLLAEVSNGKTSAALRALFHLGAMEILVDGAPDYAIVHEYVELAKSQKATRGASGFLNAILRKVSRMETLPVENNSFGEALQKSLEKHYSQAMLEEINQVQLRVPPLDIRLRKGEDVEEWAARLGGFAIPQHRAVRLANAGRISALEGYDAGKWWVQDIGASMAVDCFSDISGKRVLDLCAAPGGKTMQLADQGALVTAVDISKRRVRRVRENLTRTNLEAEIVIGDGRSFSAPQFDAILLDAPCSATGTLRRHPDLRFQHPMERLDTLLPLQAEILQHAYRLLKAGGEMIYATCSLLPQEGEEQIALFLAKSDAEQVAIDGTQFGLDNGEMPSLRSFPSDNADIGGMDGFFVAKLRKPDDC